MRGDDEASKDRPCAVVLAHETSKGTETIVAPITHTKPEIGRSCVEIPAPVKERLGLDEKRSWIMTDDLNVFTWPGPDIRPIPKSGKAGQRFAYGFLPASLTRNVLDQIRGHIHTKTAQPTRRTE